MSRATVHCRGAAFRSTRGGGLRMRRSGFHLEHWLPGRSHQCADVGFTSVNFGFNNGGVNAAGVKPGRARSGANASAAFTTGLNTTLFDALTSRAPDATTGVGQMNNNDRRQHAGPGKLRDVNLGLRVRERRPQWRLTI